jgi:hypothetical protein
VAGTDVRGAAVAAAGGATVTAAVGAGAEVQAARRKRIMVKSKVFLSIVVISSVDKVWFL